MDYMLNIAGKMKTYEVIKDPVPHILVESNKEMHGWWEGKRECTSERLLINPYAGCSISCPFCYANALWGYFQAFRKDRIITVFKDFDKVIAKQLDSIDVASCGYLSPVTDPFQKVEEKYHLSINIIHEFIKRNIPIEFITKQRVPQDVIDIMKNQKHSFGQVSILTGDEKKRRVLAPGGASTEELLDNIKRMDQAGMYSVMRLDPIIPYVTDNEDELEELIKRAKDAGAKHVIASCMDIPLKIKQDIIKALKIIVPDIEAKYKDLYTELIGGDMNAKLDYRFELFQFIKDTCTKNGMTFALCMEYKLVDSRPIGLNKYFMTSINCEGMDVPLYIRKGNEFQPLDNCSGNCLGCNGEECNIDENKLGGALTLKDYRGWKKNDDQISLFD